MTISEMIRKLEKIAEDCQINNDIDPNVYIQIGTIQTHANEISYYPSMDGLFDASVVIRDSGDPILVP